MTGVRERGLLRHEGRQEERAGQEEPRAARLGGETNPLGGAPSVHRIAALRIPDARVLLPHHAGRV